MENLKVWIIDDDTAVGELFLDSFSSEKFDVTYFDSPSKALKANHSPPDVYFIDFRMPGLNGQELAQKLSPDIPKYLVTGEAELPPVPEFIKVIFKPYRLREISSVLNEEFEKKHG